jgi:hypothetical protein
MNTRLAFADHGPRAPPWPHQRITVHVAVVCPPEASIRT